MLASPVTRLLARAALSGLAAFSVALNTGGGGGSSVVKGAAVSAVMAALEVLTPLNKTVGVGK